jgi:hypothetical protein
MFLLAILSILSCKQQMSDEDRKVGLQDFKNQEVKRVNKADIFAVGLEKGREVTNTVQAVLIGELSAKVKEENLLEAISYCNVRAYPLVDSLSRVFDVEIKRASNRFRNVQDAPDGLESQLLDAYQYSFEKGTTLNDNIQEYEAEYLIYTKPILAASPMCLECHGKDVDTTVKARLAVLYPEDKALNHQLNDLRGMWSVKIPVKDIVNSLE